MAMKRILVPARTEEDEFQGHSLPVEANSIGHLGEEPAVVVAPAVPAPEGAGSDEDGVFISSALAIGADIDADGRNDGADGDAQ
jgi:hypothetical protein